MKTLVIHPKDSTTEMKKPIKPLEPKHSDFKHDGLATDNSPFIIAYKRYMKDLEKYNNDLELYQQTKFIEDVKRSSLKLVLNKYKIIKRN